MEMDTNNLTESFGKFKESGYEAWWDEIDESSGSLGLIGLRDEGEIGVFIPNVLGEVDIERVGVIGRSRIPVSTFLFRIDDVSFENLLMSVNQFSIFYSAQFLLVHFVYLWTNMAIVQMNTVNLVLLNQLKQLVQKQVPWFFLSVI